MNDVSRPFRVAAVMPFGVRPLRWLLDGRITGDGRVVAVSAYKDLEAFRQADEAADAILLFENEFDRLQPSDPGKAMVVIMRKTEYTIRRDSFLFGGRELPMAQIPDDLLKILPIDLYRKGPFHRRLVIIAGAILLVLAVVIFVLGTL